MITNPYINAPVKINYNVVECKKDVLEEDSVILRDRAIAHLSKNHAVAEVRHALNVWYYS
jgi:hypothetical protein